MSTRPNSRSKGGIHTPIQRSGSKLEVLPPEVQTIINSETSPRQTHSAGSEGRRSHTERPCTPPFQRSSSEGRLTPNQDPLIRKHVVLPTVKRDYERYGVPKSDLGNTVEGGAAVLDDSDILTVENDDRLENDGAVGGAQRSKVEMEMEILISKLKANEESRLEKNNSQKKGNHIKDRTPDVCSEDTYYLSHTPSVESFPSCTTSDSNIQVTSSDASRDDEIGNKDSSSSSEGEEKEGEEKEEDEEEEEEKAPFELIGEFLECVMDEDYENADKLCKMILLYEPENPECKQFQPLIEEMLKREREEQLWGSSDDSESDDDDDDDSDGDEGESEDEETESSDESSDESSSDDSEGENEEEGQR